MMYERVPLKIRPDASFGNVGPERTGILGPGLPFESFGPGLIRVSASVKLTVTFFTHTQAEP